MKHPKRALNHFSALSQLCDTGILTFSLDTPVGELLRLFLFLLAYISLVGHPLQITTELGLKTKVYSLTVLKASSPQSVCGQGCAPSQTPGENLLTSVGSGQPLAWGCLTPALPPSACNLLSVPSSLLPLKRTLGIGLRAHPDNPG